MSLRAPQLASLEILDRVMDMAQPHRRHQNADGVQRMLAAIQREFPSFQDFEHAFPSLCFALATGVGKTRLMGAFVTYLFLQHSIRHFFVLAPNLTIYNKLVADFTPNTPKYVFQGISEFAVKSPTLVTGDNFEQKPQALDLFERDDIVINIFNIAKFNEKTKSADEEGKKVLRVRRLSEFLGQSYFEYLAGLDDLVLIMDEAHRYRADTSAKSIEELRPVLGLELTATPQVESGGRSTRFKNIVYDYPLSQAMQDGYVKEPAVATRAGFESNATSKKALEHIKLEDGIRLHESVMVDLEVYAQQSGAPKVKPFVLVIAEDTSHANEIVQWITSEEFFHGRYQDRVIQVHSGQKGAEKDDNIKRLLSVEAHDEPTEIVVHVNMLKEGWDVTNLYTIVPLRAADSRTLVEQSLGRGLRLPFGKRTGVPAIDRLTIVAHDRFNDIVEEARKGGYSFNTIRMGTDIADEPTRTVVVPPTYAAFLGTEATAGDSATPLHPAPTPRYTKPEDVAAAKATIEAIEKIARNPRIVPGSKSLTDADVQNKLVELVKEMTSDKQTVLYPDADSLTDAERVLLVRDVTAVYMKHTIAIPRVLVQPKDEVRAGFRDFSLNMSAFRFQPVAKEILIHHLRSGERDVVGAAMEVAPEERLEDYVVRGLIDFPDVCYDNHADLLYTLAVQVVTHLRGYLDSDDAVRNVLVYHARQIADLVHGQMRMHAWEDASSYEVTVSRGFTEIRPHAYAALAKEQERHFAVPIGNRVGIRGMLFGGFAKCLYPTQKFDSDTERRFAVLLESDRSVLKWFKPGTGVFRIRYSPDADYEPDFVVETVSEKLICETKGANRMEDAVVREKARAAAVWCEHATKYELTNEGKRWRYLLIPDNAVSESGNLATLAARFTETAPDESERQRFGMSQ